ncbi:Ribosomal RNA assembly KRR1 like protein [Aduncisulcus paluster]|uniref:KRR1 small subunit processome component n=1 Tax=Aduncisulcus paluster TaxID=2918883 RepID=A0ABQ5JZ04_9EUKA|nr:Ribosomal RNA assembly KRR1 like protein [Aduncisulcus paluster]
MEFFDHPFLEVSRFSVAFPSYRQQYIQNIWPELEALLKTINIACELDIIEGKMEVLTTRNTRDPWAIIQARNMIQLLSRSVPIQHAKRVLDDNTYCEVIKIKTMCRNRDRFVKRRQRLIGKDGQTLKVLELLTGCYMLVQGNTVSVIGPYNKLPLIRSIVEDCMKNIHPLYHIRRLYVQRELMRNPKMAKKSWDRFMPQFVKNVKKEKEKLKKSKKEEREKQNTGEMDGEKGDKEDADIGSISGFKREPWMRKEDIKMLSGEHFIVGEGKKTKKHREHKEQDHKEQNKGKGTSGSDRKHELKKLRRKRKKMSDHK